MKKSIAEFASGKLSKQQIRAVLEHALTIDPAYAEAIEEYLDVELKRNRLSARDHRELIQTLTPPASESEPTEASDETPDEPGLYKMDSEGTLILADGFEPEPAPPIADEGSSPVAKTPEPVAKQESLVARLPVGTVLRERFRLDQEVASGSMGIVYRATDLLKMEAGANSPEVAIKVINPEFANDRAALKSFQNEVANTQHLSHPNIIHLFELDKDKDHFFITMEWLEGEALDTLLDSSHGSALPPVQAYAIIEQLCDALAYAHDRGVVHADVKPGNVFLLSSGELKLIDFGIARFDNPQGDAGVQDHTIALTPAYASCECLERQRPTQQDDLYSLACLVYRLLSGRRVFGSMTALQAEAEHMEPVPIGGVSNTRWAALRKALSFRREDRQADVQAFADEFGQRRVTREDEQPDILPESPPEVDLAVDLNETPEPESMVDTGLLDETTLGLHDTAKLGALSLPNSTNPLVADSVPDSAQPDSGEPKNSLSPLEVSLQLEDDLPSDGASTAAVDSAADDEAAAIDVEAIRAQAMAELRGSQPSPDAMPEPINFFDNDCDESVFIPLEKQSTQLESGTGTADLGDMPQISAGEPARPAGSDKVKTPAASISPESTVPQPEQPASVAAKPEAAAAKPKVRPAAADQGPASTVAVLAGRRYGGAAQAGSGNGLQRVTRLITDKPALAVGAAAVVVAVTVFFLSGKDQGAETPRQVSQPAAQSRAMAGRPVPAASVPVVTGRSPGSVPNALTSRAVPIVGQPASGSQMGQVPVNTSDSGAAFQQRPVNTVDTGIAPEGAAVPIPLDDGGAVAGSTAAQGGSDSVLLALNNLARKAIVEDRWAEPEQDNAATWVSKMRAQAPDDPLTQEIEAKLSNEFLGRAERAVERGDFAAAIRWVKRAEENRAQGARLQRLRARIQDARKQTTAAADAALAAKAVVSVGEFDFGNSVPLSSLDFIKYVEPVFPDRSRQAPVTGWVDVGFIVDPQGFPRDLQVIGSSLPAGFVDPFLDAVKQWQFKPRPVDDSATVTRTSVRLHYED